MSVAYVPIYNKYTYVCLCVTVFALEQRRRSFDNCTQLATFSYILVGIVASRRILHCQRRGYEAYLLVFTHPARRDEICSRTVPFRLPSSVCDAFFDAFRLHPAYGFCSLRIGVRRIWET